QRGWQLERVDLHSGVLVHSAELFVLVHGRREPPRAACTLSGRARVALRDVAHELDGADAAIEQILEDFGGAAGQGAEAVGDGADLNSTESGVRFGGERSRAARDGAELAASVKHRPTGLSQVAVLRQRNPVEIAADGRLN